MSVLGGWNAQVQGNHLHLILLQFGKRNKLVGVHGNQSYMLYSTLDVFLNDTQGRSTKLSLPSTLGALQV